MNLFSLPIKAVVFPTENPNSTKKCLWWLKTHLNLNLRTQQQLKFKVHSFYYKIISPSKTKTLCYFVVVFVCIDSTMFYKNIFSIELKNGFFLPEIREIAF